MQSLIAIGLGHSHPVAYALGMRSVEVGQRGIYAITHLLLPHPLRRVKDDTHGIQVIYLLKRQMLGFHFIVNGIDRLKARFGLVFYAELVEFLLYGQRKIAVHLGAPCLAFLDFIRNLLVYIGVLILETKVLKFGLDRKETKTVSQRRIDIKSLTCDFIALVGSH